MDYLNKEQWIQDLESGIRIEKNIAVDTAFSDDEQDLLMSLEDNSWWFSHRADVITRLMDQYFVKDKLTIDIGGGNGYTSYIAKKKGYLTGIIEPNPVACRNAKLRGLDEINCGTVTEESVLDEAMEQVLLLDVLEHIEDDLAFIGLLKQKLISDGYLLITVPAFMCLWSSEDDAARHYRRYRLKEICNLLQSNGFDICYRSYFMGFLFIPVLFVRVFLEKIGVLKSHNQRSEKERNRISRQQFLSGSGIVYYLLSVFENIEIFLMRKENRVPFGSSIIVLAKKR